MKWWRNGASASKGRAAMVQAKPVETSSTGASGHQLSFPQAVALIMGSIIGVGIFSLPASLAAYGPISLLAMALTTVGALALAVMFGTLSRRLPADGGPYAYSRVAFGNTVGFANAWSYWITAWAGNAAIVAGWVFPPWPSAFPSTPISAAA